MCGMKPPTLTARRPENTWLLARRRPVKHNAEAPTTPSRRGVRREDPNSVYIEDADNQIKDVRDLFTIYQQIEASDSTTNRDALARLEFLLAENNESKGQLAVARAGYEKVLFEYPHTIWAPKAAINIAGVCDNGGHGLQLI